LYLTNWFLEYRVSIRDALVGNANMWYFIDTSQYLQQAARRNSKNEKKKKKKKTEHHLHTRIPILCRDIHPLPLPKQTRPIIRLVRLILQRESRAQLHAIHIICLPALAFVFCTGTQACKAACLITHVDVSKRGLVGDEDVILAFWAGIV
jgi:hypothetical protein